MSAVIAIVVLAPTLASAQAPFDVVHTFDAPQATIEPPSASVIMAADGDLYVTSAGGGSFQGRVVNQGMVFRMTPAGVITMLHEFSGGSDGATPLAPLLEASDGYFYGTTARGGENGLGTVFRMAPGGAIATLHSFAGGSDGARPLAAVIQATDGNFYGTTAAGGTYDFGTVFRMTPDGGVTTLYSFSNGPASPGPLLQGPDGNFFGTAPTFPVYPYKNGVLFKMTPSGIVTFPNPFLFAGPLIQESDQVFCVPYMNSPTSVWLLRFRTDGHPPGTVDLIHDFGDAGPVGALEREANGDFYGTTSRDGAFGHGTVFKVTADGVRTTLYSLPGSSDDPGAHPRKTSLVRAPDGSLYGAGPANRPGEIAVFRVTATGGATVLYTFVAGREAPGLLSLQASDGNFYGLSSDGGAFGRGTAFRMTPYGSYSVLHTFAGGATDGANPAALIQGHDGAFYGTTAGGGASGNGTIFKLTAGGTATLLHSFAGVAEGAQGNFLIQASDGNFYGTTKRGGLFDGGTAFRMNVDGVVTVLHSFDGGVPGSFIQATDGNFYGTAVTGCTGEVFRMSPGGAIATLHSVNTTDGDYCMGMPGIIQGLDGNLYGMTYSNSTIVGSFYRIGPDGTVTVVRRFDLRLNGMPMAPLVPATDGSFYGMFSGPRPDYTGMFPGEAISRITADGTVTALREGVYGVSLLQGTDGNLYGTTDTAMFRLRLKPPTHRDGDLDGDGKADVSVFHPSTGTWYGILSSTGAGVSLGQWGLDGDVPVPGDYDGDGKIDLGVFRPSKGIWYLLNSSTGRTAFYQWGVAGDVPVPRDYDGDGKSDVAVYRPSTGIWYVIYSTTAAGAFFQWGLPGDVPVPGDYDGDGKSDVAVFRPATGIWYVIQSRTATGAFFQWGLDGDLPVPGDYDGDRKTDVAVFRPSTGIWYIVNSSTRTGAFYRWGLDGDAPVPADYDGDGKTDVAVFRPSTGIWYIVNSSTGGSTFYQWGGSGDIPVLKR